MPENTMIQNKQPFSTSQASLPSSFSPSAATSMLLPATHSSHPDITNSDRLPANSSTTFKSIFGVPASYPQARSFSSTSSMGQVVSRPQDTSTFPPAPAPSSLGTPASSAGSRIKRAFVGRRKKSDTLAPPSPQINKGGDLPRDDLLYGSPSTPPRQIGAKQLTRQLAQHVFNKKQQGSTTASPAMSVNSLPPPLPPKQLPASAPSSPQSSRLAPIHTNIDRRISILTTSSPIAPALDFMRRSDEQMEQVPGKENQRREVERSETKEIRRKSDSTLSHHTIRPTLGTRTSRPVSVADSLHSTNTVVPVNKRLSALLTDAEYYMPEEEDGERKEERGHAFTRRASPASSLCLRDRRSQSLNLGPSLSLVVAGSTAATATMSLEAITVTLPRTAQEERDQEQLMHQTTATATFSSSRSDTTRVAGKPSSIVIPPPHQMPKLPLSHVERTLPDVPGPLRRPTLPPPPDLAHPSFRQTAISMTSGFAPAAGLARRAVEKMGRVWGSKSSFSGPLASPVGMPPSSFSHGRPGPPSRASSSYSESLHGHGRKSRHNPQTPSVGSTSSSLSDHGGPQLGTCLRGPICVSRGGLVFGRDLKMCVKDTVIDSARSTVYAQHTLTQNQIEESDSEHVLRSEPSGLLESRYIPALVVRCTQHILAWGVEEQGLFRVSGRSSHVAKLRAEFDTGADFDLAQSNPGDLDPHAVASIFKAYLRELPESILTNQLMPFFDAVMASERSTNNTLDPLPSKSIHPGLRKPPSLSTLGMPVFGGPHPPSESLRNALASLISRLPQENRDLLLTVTEVINHTSKRSSETKMPLSNLLLVLCPSLSMNPSLLQALCESQGIWDGVYDLPEGVDDAAAGDLYQSPVDSLGAVNQSEAETAVGISSPRSSNDNKRVTRPLPNLPIEDVPEVPTHGPFCATAPLLYSEAPGPQSSHDSAHHIPTDSETSSSFTTDDSSSISHLSQGGRPVTPTSVNFKLITPYSPPSLSCSTDSLSTPSLSSGSPIHSVKPLALVAECGERQSSPSPHSPEIAEPITLPIPSLRATQPGSEAQFQFPGPRDNVTRSPLNHHKSTPSISFSSSVSAEARSASLVTRAKRMKKPSLHILFAKRSASPISSPTTQSPVIGASSLTRLREAPPRPSSSSESSPDSMVTAPQSSRFSYPPVLDTAIDESSISLALGIEDNHGDYAASVGHTIKDGTLMTSSSRLPRSSETTEGRFHHLDIPLPKDEFGDANWTRSVLLAAGESGW